MNKQPVYEARDLVPVATGPFSFRARRRAMQRSKWDSTQVVLPATFDAPSLVSPAAVATIRKAFTLAKTSKDAWKSYRRDGRFDVRQAPRASRGEQDVFKKRTGQSTTKVRCAVLIDGSGSMHVDQTGRIEVPDLPGRKASVTAALAAGVFGATIAKALGSVPTIDLDVFQHAAGRQMPTNYYGEPGKVATLTLKWRWHRGTPVSVFNTAYQGIGGGGNADGHAIFAITEKMRRELKRGEKGVILVVSDGLPSVYATDGLATAGQALIDAVAHARKHGITVVGVAIDGSDQSTFYGSDTIPFDGSWTTLGSALARLIGSALAVK